MQNQATRNNNRKKKLAVLALLVVCLAIIATGTLAYYTAQETAYNVITTGTLSMDLHDETTGGKPFPEEGIKGVMPGRVVDKVVYVENDGDVSFWTRIKLVKKITASDGNTERLNFNKITLDLNTADWTEHDGYYYYNKPLNPGEETAKLFNKVTFSKSLGNAYMDARVEINVIAQAVQSKNNGSSALDAIGWGED